MRKQNERRGNRTKIDRNQSLIGRGINAARRTEIVRQEVPREVVARSDGHVAAVLAIDLRAGGVVEERERVPVVREGENQMEVELLCEFDDLVEPLKTVRASVDLSLAVLDQLEPGTVDGYLGDV